MCAGDGRVQILQLVFASTSLVPLASAAAASCSFLCSFACAFHVQQAPRRGTWWTHQSTSLEPSHLHLRQGAKNGDMVDTFGRMLGVHLVAANEKPPDTVKSWNVRIMKLHPNDRHGDMQLARDFYTYLDAMLGAKKSALAY